MDTGYGLGRGEGGVSYDDVEVSKGIVVNPERCGGKPTIKGTRILAEMVARYQEGPDSMNPQDIIESYPSLTIADCINAKLWAARR